MLATAAAVYAEPVVWSFDVETSGDDVQWRSDSGIGFTAPGYRFHVKISFLEVSGTWQSIAGDIDLSKDATDDLPDGWDDIEESAAGPLPVVIVDDMLEYPEPPDIPGLAARILVTLDEKGFGTFDVRDLLMDVIEHEFITGLPGIHVLVTHIRVVGSIEVSPMETTIVNTRELEINDGGTTTFTVALSRAPAEDTLVDVEIDSDDEDLRVESGELLLFNAANWSTPQLVTLAADRDEDGNSSEATVNITTDNYATSRIQLTEREADCNENARPDDVELAEDAGLDCDEDGVLDACERDRDQDGIIDDCDDCPDDPEKTAPGLCGCGVEDIDADRDGVGDCYDQCPDSPAGSEVAPNGCPLNDCNANGVPDADDIRDRLSDDCDDNGVPDECEPDRDGDGVIDACDNCPDLPNANQTTAPCELEADANAIAQDDPNATRDPNAPDADAALDAGELDEIPPDLGAVLCGAGLIGWLIFGLVGLGGVRIHRAARR